MSSFYVIRGQDNGTHFPIRGHFARIGRGNACTIRLNDTEVSRQHAMIVRTDDGEHDIVDNASSNGTYVNSRRVSRTTLRSGDRVQIGRTLMIYTGGPEPHDSSALVGLHGKQTASSVELVSGPEARDLSHITRSIEATLSGDSLAAHSSSIPPSGYKQHRIAKDAATEPQPNSNATSSLAGDNALAADNLPASGLAAESSATRETLEGSEAFENDVAAPPPTTATVSIDNSDWEILYQVSQAVHRTVDLEELLNQVLGLIFQWIGCDRGCILMFDPVTGHLTPSCSRDNQTNRSATARPPRRIRISQTILEHVVQTREGVLTSNAQGDSRWENVESIASIGVHEAICTPMLGRYGMVGTIYVDTTLSAGDYAMRKQQPTFDEHHLKLIMAIAGQAALAIEDTQFYHAVLQSERLAAMGQTIANLSHHVKNILQGVKGGSFLVEDGLKKEKLDVVARGWNIVKRNQDRISNLVMDMLSFSKDREPQVQRGDVTSMVREVVELMALRGDEQGVEVKLLTDESISADFDHEAMHQALLNVVTNGIDACLAMDEALVEDPDGRTSSASRPRVSVQIKADEGQNVVQIAVTDSGPGIAADEIAGIFKPFQSSKGARGTGLGLPVSEKVLREHGGEIVVTSEPGKGATFTLRWPLLCEAQTLANTRESPPA